MCFLYFYDIASGLSTSVISRYRKGDRRPNIRGKQLEQLSKNFNELISTLNINMAELARSSSCDSSLLSKIRTGNTNPSKPKIFIENVCNFVVKKYKSEDDKKAVAILIGCSLRDLKDNSSYYNKLFKWFSTNI